MKKALIQGSRVAQVELVGFPVALPLKWVDCADDAKPETHYFDGAAVVPIPPPPEPPLAEQKVSAEREIDEKAGEVRKRYITSVAGQEATYLVKERQAEAFKAALYVGTVPGLVQAEVDATGQAAQQACDAILAERDGWLLKAAQVEKARRAGKVAVGKALDGASVKASLAAALAELDAL